MQECTDKLKKKSLLMPVYSPINTVNMFKHKHIEYCVINERQKNDQNGYNWCYILSIHFLIASGWKKLRKKLTVFPSWLSGVILMIFAGRICGKTKPKPIVSLTNRLTVYFNSNERDTDKGFKAHFKAVDPSETSGTTTFTTNHDMLHSSCKQLASKKDVRLMRWAEIGVNVFTGLGQHVNLKPFPSLFPVWRISWSRWISSRWTRGIDDPWIPCEELLWFSTLPGTGPKGVTSISAAIALRLKWEEEEKNND